MNWLASIWTWLTASSKADELDALRVRMAMLEVRMTNLERRVAFLEVPPPVAVFVPPANSPIL